MLGAGRVVAGEGRQHGERPDQPRGQGAVRRARRDEARPRPLLRGGRGAADAGDGRPARCSCSASRRAPAGPSFFQKRVPENAPGLAGDDDRGRRSTARPSRALVAADVAHVAVGGEPRLPRLPRLALPGRRPRPRRRAAARPRPAARRRTSPRRARPPASCRRCSTSSGIAGYPKTTGNRGLHVYVRLEPRWDSYEVRAAAVAVARELERRRPDLITAAWWKEERGQRVFVDYNQNAPHKTVFGAWSVRARPGAQVSTPFAWDGARRHPPGRS